MSTDGLPPPPRMKDYDRINLDYVIRSGDWWEADLLRLIANADMLNRARLRRVYPEHVETVERWQRRGT